MIEIKQPARVRGLCLKTHCSASKWDADCGHGFRTRDVPASGSATRRVSYTALGRDCGDDAGSGVVSRLVRTRWLDRPARESCFIVLGDSQSASRQPFLIASPEGRLLACVGLRMGGRAARGDMTMAQIARALGVGRTTLYEHL